MAERGATTDRAPVAIVTGAARGIGAAVAARLADRGLHVALVDLPHDLVAEAAHRGPWRASLGRELDEATARCGDRGHAHVADVRDPEALRRVVDTVIDHHGTIDVVVAAAGSQAGGSPLWETDDTTWREMLDTNLTGVFNLARATLPSMLAAPAPRRGRVVAIASAAAGTGLPLLSAYTAAKTGVLGLVRSLAAELADSGITANAVCPGSTRGHMLDASAAIYGLADATDFAAQARIRRLIEPDEIAATVEWLCLDAPGALTGSVIDVDGGMRS